MMRTAAIVAFLLASALSQEAIAQLPTYPGFRAPVATLGVDLSLRDVKEQADAAMSLLTTDRPVTVCFQAVGFTTCMTRLLRENAEMTSARLREEQRFIFSMPQSWEAFEISQDDLVWLPESAIANSSEVFATLSQTGVAGCRRFNWYANECVSVLPTRSVEQRESSGFSVCRHLVVGPGARLGGPTQNIRKNFECEPIAMDFGGARFIRVNGAGLTAPRSYRKDAIVFQYHLFTKQWDALNAAARTDELLDELSRLSRDDPLRLDTTLSDGVHFLFAYGGPRHTPVWKLWEDLTVAIAGKPVGVDAQRPDVITINITSRLSLRVTELSVNNEQSWHGPPPEMQRAYERDIVTAMTKSAEKACAEHAKTYKLQTSFAASYGGIIEFSCRE